jgi:Lrp/AsnC family leucine-responsive transcriptional regulator
LPQVQEVHEVAGEDCFLVKLRVRDTDALARLLRDQIGAIPGVASTRTTIVLSTFKETTEIELPPREEPR